MNAEANALCIGCNTLLPIGHTATWCERCEPQVPTLAPKHRSGQDTRSAVRRLISGTHKLTDAQMLNTTRLARIEAKLDRLTDLVEKIVGDKPLSYGCVADWPAFDDYLLKLETGEINGKV